VTIILHYYQGSAVANKPARHAASRRTCCKQVTWTLSVIKAKFHYGIWSQTA